MNAHGPEEADITLAGLRIWVHGREFPDVEEYWDANWLYCTAECVAEDARVVVSGCFLHLPELFSWLEQCETLYKMPSGEAVLDPMEPTIGIRMVAQAHGQMSVRVELTPEHMSPMRRFEFKADQTHLGFVIGQLRRLNQKYPIRGRVDALR